MKMNVKQVHEVFFEKNVSIHMIYQMVREQKIPHIKLSDYKILFDSEKLEQWWKNKQIEVREEQEQKSELEYGKLRKIF